MRHRSLCFKLGCLHTPLVRTEQNEAADDFAVKLTNTSKYLTQHHSWGLFRSGGNGTEPGVSIPSTEMDEGVADGKREKVGES
jgi:hypothetical protein